MGGRRVKSRCEKWREPLAAAWRLPKIARSYKVAEAVYDATVVFCRRFFAHDRRMSDQMVQAARSGVRNISEGSGAARYIAQERDETYQCGSRKFIG